MNQELLKKVISKEYLIIITDNKGNILFRANSSPVSEFFTSYYKNDINLKNKELLIYANQVGLALTTLSELENVIEYIGHIISEPAEEIISKMKIKYYYNKKIELIKSSKDDSKVCPIEESLSKLENSKDRIEFLENKFNKN